MFHSQLTLLMEMFHKNGYPENIIDGCVKLLINKIYTLKKDTCSRKKPMQTRNKFRNSIKVNLTVKTLVILKI